MRNQKPLTWPAVLVINQALVEGMQSMTGARELDQQRIYHIRVKGNLDKKWEDWFDGLTIRQEANDETVLAGTVADQCALHGLLAKVRDLGLPLLSVEQGEVEE